MKLRKNRFLIAILSLVLYFYILFVHHTRSWNIIGFDKLRQKLSNREPVIIAFWHGRLALMPNFAPHPEEVHVMISRHGDGELIARIINFFGIKFIRGSSNRIVKHKQRIKNRGGAGALREALNVIKEGHTVCITPDGPVGPRMRVSSAIAEIAKYSGVAIYPVTYSTHNAKVLNSWDRLLFPFPFGLAYFIVGEPIYVASDASDDDLEKTRNEIENQLNRITREADILAGRQPVEPA